MKEKTLVICDDDKEYIDRLGRYISMRGEAKLRVACFSERRLFAEYVGQNQVDMFLAGTGWIDETLCGDRRRWLMLTDEEESEPRQKGYRQIRKYQAADELLTKVLQCMEFPGAGGAEIFPSRVGIYSPSGWTESTRLAMALTARLGKDGPSLYVGLNEFSPIMKLSGRCKNYDLSDVAYSWRRGRLDYGQLERMTSHLEGFDGIPAPVNPAELAEISGTEVEALLENICAVGGYRNMVMDFGSSISGRHSLFEHCGRNVVIFPATESGLYQQEEFEQFWRSVGAEALLNHTECIVLPLEEFRDNRKGRGEGYMDELAERLLRRREGDERERGLIVCGGD